MSKLVLLIALATLPMPALVATAQQEKMKKCSAEAKGLKGEEYKKVHTACLKAKPAAAAPATPAAAATPAPAAAATTAEGKKLTPQEKMKKCGAEAKGLKGEEYKKVHDACLKS